MLVIDGIELYETTVYDLPEETYYISKEGRVYNYNLKRFLSISIDKDGYERVNLTTNHGKKKFSVAKLVLATFKGYPPTNMIDPTVEHKDGIRNNNMISNLEWLERPQNSSQRHITPKGERNPKNKLSEDEVKEICLLLQNNISSLSEIASKYNVSKDNIRDIKRRKIWCDISKEYYFSQTERGETSA